MKRSIIVGGGIGIGCVMLALAGCSGNIGKGSVEDVKEMPVLEFEGYRYDAVAEVADSDALDVEGGKYWRFSGKGMLPVKIGSKDISQLRDSLERLGGVLVIDKSHSDPRIENDLTLTDLKPEEAKACNVTSNLLTVVLCSPEVVVWKNFSYSYLCQAAHGMYNTTFVNYSVDDGKMLDVKDLMKPGYEDELRGMIRKKIKEMGVALLVPLDEVEIPKDFEMTSQGIRFVYGLYEIAPYVEGEITVEFDGYELENIFADGVYSRYFSLAQ